MKLLDDRVAIVQENKTMGKSKLGIIIPTSAQENVMRGKVKAVGPGRVLNDGTRLTPSVKVGDIVIIGKYTTTEITVSGEDVIIIRESDIMAIE